MSFLGSFPHIESVLALGDLSSLPSVQESFGLTALEAMASGLPVVASRAGSIPEVVVDGETGFLCEPEDVVGMAAALKLLSDEGLYRAFSEAARRRAVKHFSEEQVVPRYLEAYERALSVGASGR